MIGSPQGRPAPASWIARLDEAPRTLADPIVWVAPHAALLRHPLPSPEAEDLVDGALARRGGGGGRVLRRRMLRALIGRVCAVHPSAVRFTREAGGRPGVEGGHFISVAGCTAAGGDWSAVVLSPEPVGVDLEAGVRDDTLGRWTLTEAYLKALGRGLSTAPEDVLVERVGEFGAGNHWRLSSRGAPTGNGQLHLTGPVVAAVVIASSGHQRQRPVQPQETSVDAGLSPWL